jgi:hypothetical protein
MATTPIIIIRITAGIMAIPIEVSAANLRRLGYATRTLSGATLRTVEVVSREFFLFEFFLLRWPADCAAKDSILQGS